MKKIVVADIMTRNPITISPDTDLLSCTKIMVKKRTGSLLLVQDKKLVGIISRSDILWAIVKKSKQDLSKIRAIDISPRKIATIKPTRSLDYALKKIKKVKRARLPVIYKGELVGLITAKDIFQYNPSTFPELTEYHQIREWEDKTERIEKARYRDILEGICNECGNQGILINVEGELICEDCAESF
jgi:CBS domain-containing protein